MIKKCHFCATAASLVLLVAALILAALCQTVTVNAQANDAVVIIQPSIGGTTNPAPGTYTYASDTTINLTATPDPGYAFQYWIVSGNVTPGHEASAQANSSVITDPDTGQIIGYLTRPPVVTSIDSLTFTTNPATITCGYGYTFQYQAVFVPTGASTGTTSSPGVSPGASPTNVTSPGSATVIVLPSSFGTTNPAPGTYSYPNGTSITLSATPNSGYSFHYWVVSGNVTPGHEQIQNTTTIVDPNTGQVVATIPRPQVLTGIDSLTFSTNPVTITCGYGYTFAYQAVFTPTNETGHSPLPGTTGSPGTTPSPTIPEFPALIALPLAIAVALILIIAVRRNKR